MKKLLVVVILALAACVAPQKISQPTRGLQEKINPQALLSSNVEMRQPVVEHVSAPHFTFDVTCVKPDGTVRWHEVANNTVLTGGKNDLLDKYFKGSTYTAAWYMALKHTGAINATDVWTSHAGWTEANPYTGNRPAITFGTTSAGSNTATAVSYSITSTDADVKGACVSSSNTGTTGILYSCTDFAAARSVISGDTLNVTLTVTD